MNKTTAEKFKMFVNTPGVDKGLSEYVDHRIEILKNELLSSSSIEEVRGIQKAVQELKRLKTLRDEVNNPSGD